MILSLVLFENELINVIAISFTSLIFVELIMVGLYISTWYADLLYLYLSMHMLMFYSLNYNCRHVYNVLAEMVTLLIYLVSMALLPEYFGRYFNSC